MKYFVPAAQGTRAIFAIPDGRAVLRAVVAWEMKDLFLGTARPITLVQEGGLPAEVEDLPLPRAVVFPDGHVESVNGGRAWASVDDYCAARKLKLVSL